MSKLLSLNVASSGDDMQRLCPAMNFPLIHIAGTNGKGSVSTKIAKVLELSGLKTGLYTSPHIHAYEERITINGNPISKEEVSYHLEVLFKTCSAPSFFGMSTLMAFRYFCEQKVDVAVIETGLGGRKDDTNIIQPILSVITSIGKDHTAILGETIEEIALEKAGIIKPNVPVVLGPTAALPPILEIAKLQNAPVHICPPCQGTFDEQNTQIALTAIEVLKKHFKLTHILEGVASIPSCRFERIGNVIFDVAHNPPAFDALLIALQKIHPGPYRFLVGMSKDKDIGECLSRIASKAVHIHLVQAEMPRAASTESMAQMLQGNYTCEKSIADGIKNALRASRIEGHLLAVTGSFYIMSEAKLAHRAL